MADVDSAFKNWSTTASSNAPTGGTTIGAGLDDNLREIQAVIRAALGSKGADIASASTTDLGAVAGLYHDITGTTTITSFGTVSHGIWKFLQFDGALTLTHNATSLILPSGANIKTAAGDIAIVISEGSGNWRCISYQRASGLVVAGDFGAVGDGTTDDTTALTAFFNSAIANPGVPHRLLNKTYAITAQLPTINVSNVIVECPGAAIHDVGSLFNGAVIKWTGASGGTMQEVSSVSGASNQKIKNIKLTGIAYDANSLAAKGLVIKSVAESDIYVAVANATTDGLTLDVVATLGEARDTQRNRIRFIGRQIEAPGGVALRVKGDATANASMNEIWADIQHKNASAIIEENADNNDWLFVRALLASGGTAVEAISWFGGATEPETCREERFHFLSSSLTSQAYGTGTYTVAAQKIRIFCLDSGNGTPIPTLGTGASVFWNKSSTPFGDTPWATYTPTITAAAGTFTTVSATGRYLQRGRIIHVQIAITITTNGTAATAILATLPIANGAGVGWIFHGKETSVTGHAQVGIVGGSASSVSITGYDGLYSGGSGRTITVTGWYEIA